MAAGHADVDAQHADLDSCADLEQFQSQTLAGGIGQLGARQPDTAQCFEHHVREGGKLQPQLIGPHRRRRGAISEQV